MTTRLSNTAFLILFAAVFLFLAGPVAHKTWLEVQFLLEVLP